MLNFFSFVRILLLCSFAFCYFLHFAFGIFCFPNLGIDIFCILLAKAEDGQMRVTWTVLCTLLGSMGFLVLTRCMNHMVNSWAVWYCTCRRCVCLLVCFTLNSNNCYHLLVVQLSPAVFKCMEFCQLCWSSNSKLNYSLMRVEIVFFGDRLRFDFLRSTPNDCVTNELTFVGKHFLAQNMFYVDSLFSLTRHGCQLAGSHTVNLKHVFCDSSWLPACWQPYNKTQSI